MEKSKNHSKSKRRRRKRERGGRKENSILTYKSPVNWWYRPVSNPSCRNNNGMVYDRQGFSDSPSQGFKKVSHNLYGKGIFITTFTTSPRI